MGNAHELSHEAVEPWERPPLRRYSQHFHILDEVADIDGITTAERGAWSDRCCGLACLRTILHHHGLGVPTQAELLEQAIRDSAFSEAGIIHHKLVDIATQFGLSGRALPVRDLERLFEMGAEGYPSVVSVTRKFPNDGRRGGHLVIADRPSDQEATEVNFVDPSRWGRTHDRVPLERFRASYSGRAIVFWPEASGGLPSKFRSLLKGL